MNAENQQEDTRRSRSRRLATLGRPAPRRPRPPHPGPQGRAPSTPPWPASPGTRAPARAPASYRRSRTWPSATSWERLRLSRGTVCSSAGPAAGKPGRRPRLGGERHGQRTGGGRGPRSPRQLPATPRLRPRQTVRSAQAHGPAPPPVRTRRSGQGRRERARGPAPNVVARARGEAGAGRADGRRGSGSARGEGGARGGRRAGGAARGGRSAGLGVTGWAQGLGQRGPSSRRGGKVPALARKAALYQVGRLGKDLVVVIWGARPGKDLLRAGMINPGDGLNV